MSSYVDEATDQFLSEWTAAFSQECARGIARIRPTLKERGLYALALAVADFNTVPAFYAGTEAGLATLSFDRDDEDDCRHYRWWPDEWVYDEDDVDSDELVRLSEAIGDFHDARYAAIEAESGEDEAERYGTYWQEASTQALIDVLNSEVIRAEYEAIGAQPVLFATEVDGELDLAQRSLMEANPGRKDELFTHACSYYVIDEA